MNCLVLIFMCYCLEHSNGMVSDHFFVLETSVDTGPIKAQAQEIYEYLTYMSSTLTKSDLPKHYIPKYAVGFWYKYSVSMQKKIEWLIWWLWFFRWHLFMILKGPFKHYPSKSDSWAGLLLIILAYTLWLKNTDRRIGRFKNVLVMKCLNGPTADWHHSVTQLDIWTKVLFCFC